LARRLWSGRFDKNGMLENRQLRPDREWRALASRFMVRPHLSGPTMKLPPEKHQSIYFTMSYATKMPERPQNHR
jgi:hypothetical protein